MTDINFIGVENDKAVFRNEGIIKRRAIRMIDGKPAFKFKKQTFIIKEDGKSIEGLEITTNGENLTIPSIKTSAPTPIQSEFSINKRFEFLEKFTKMVLDGITNSIIITGEGGLGKTHTVLNQIESKGLAENEDYVVVKGFSTPKALYATLYENKNSLIVFDDCDSVLKDPTSLNILKGALDSYDKRVISWLSRGFIDDGLPASFEFEGQIIFISNMPSYKMDGAVKSRSMVIDVSMTLQDKIERMTAILPNIEEYASMDMKQEVLDYMAEHAEEATEFNIRTLIKCIKVRVAYGESTEWKDAVKYLLTSN